MRGADDSGFVTVVEEGLKNDNVDEKKKDDDGRRLKRLFKLLWRACPSWRVRDREEEAMVIVV